MKKLSEKLLSVFAVLAFLPSVLVAQSPDQNTGDRERYVSNANGDLVAVVSPVNNEARVVFRKGAQEVPVIGFGDSVPGLADLQAGDEASRTGEAKGPVYGVGHPAMNDQGVIAVTVSLTSRNIEVVSDSSSGNNDSALLVGTPGNLQLVAHTLQNIGGDIICSLEPMPQINDNGQVFFSATLQAPNLHADEPTNELRDVYCDEDGGRRNGQSNAVTSLWTKSRKGIFRFTPPNTVERLLFASMDLSEAQEITTSDSRWVSASTTYDIIDAQLIAHSHNTVTSGGAAFALVWLTDSPTFSEDEGRSDDGDFRQGILYLNGSAPQLVAATERSPEDISLPPVSSDFGYLGKMAADSNGRAVFKTALSYRRLSCVTPSAVEEYCYNDGMPSQLYVFTQNSGLSATPLVATGDAVPGAPGSTFNGFPPLMSTNDSGAVAFTAGLTVENICAQNINNEGLTVDVPPTNRGNENWADYCKGVYLATAGGTITELARNTRAAFDGDGLGASQWTSEDGTETFYFDGISATAVLDRTQTNRVYFVAWEDEDRSDPTDSQTNGRFSASKFQPRDECGLDENCGRQGIFVWDNGVISKVLAEGDEVLLGEGDNAWEQVTSIQTKGLIDRLAGLLGIAPAYAQDGLPTATVVRLFLPQPQLRGHTGSGEFQFAVRAWFDTNDDDTADFDSMVNPSFIPPVPPVPVPAGSNIMAILLGMMLMVFGLVILRGRA